MIILYGINFVVPLPCIMSDWTKWSVVDDTGTTYRYRYVLRPALNSGKECEDLLQIKKGYYYFFNEYKSYDILCLLAVRLTWMKNVIGGNM
jgi:hypothetical protein